MGHRQDMLELEAFTRTTEEWLSTSGGGLCADVPSNTTGVNETWLSRAEPLIKSSPLRKLLLLRFINEMTIH